MSSSHDDPQILRPKPRKMWTTSPFTSEPTSPHPGSPDSPTALSNTSNELRSPASTAAYFSAPRTRSVLNLTASTLAGIYAPDDDSSIFGVTPSGATTPLYPPSPHPGSFSASLHRAANGITENERERDRMAPVIGALEQPQFRRTPTALVNTPTSPTYVRVARGLVRAALLFAIGAAYGGLVTHLHDTRNLAPVKIDGLQRGKLSYTLFWGIAGLLLGTALPIVDAIWAGEGPAEKAARETAERAQLLQQTSQRRKNREGDQDSTLSEGVGLGAEWNPMVRSIGAFIGIGFAIRRLPWQSTLQASLTLALVNPCLWYMIDRSFPGFALASAVGVVGTSVLLGTNVVPMPDLRGAVGATGPGSNGSSLANEALPLGIDQGALAVAVWVASVLFCSCVCFGNIGRRLAVSVSSA